MATASGFQRNGMGEGEFTRMQMRDVKVCLLGDSGVGKSSIVMRFVTGTYRPALESTIGASFMSKSLVVDGTGYRFQIWDTAGQEKFRSLAPMYYRGAAAAVIVYDVTRPTTFKAVKAWIQELRSFGPRDIVIAIAGNKCDLEELREVTEKDAQEYASSINAIFGETSAMTAVNVEEMFTALARQLPPEEELPSAGSVVNLRNQSGGSRQEAGKRRSCCGGGATGSGPGGSSGAGRASLQAEPSRQQNYRFS
ncbi:ras-related protein Rab-22A-like [Babylonia areolata]|uniref:ras-related protein Rab-22A-like n=1 Tax=Babylonia areolata TaxID=304850 RepID=UPI003FD3CEC7